MTGHPTWPAKALGSAASIPATQIKAAQRRRSGTRERSRYGPATPTSWINSEATPIQANVSRASRATDSSVVPAVTTPTRRALCTASGSKGTCEQETRSVLARWFQRVDGNTSASTRTCSGKMRVMRISSVVSRRRSVTRRIASVDLPCPKTTSGYPVRFKRSRSGVRFPSEGIDTASTFCPNSRADSWPDWNRRKSSSIGVSPL